MRHDLVGEMGTVFNTMNEAERRAYSLGISHTFGHVFTIIMQTDLDGAGLQEARARLHCHWNDIRDIQAKMGVL